MQRVAPTPKRRGRPRKVESYADWMARIDAEVSAMVQKVEPDHSVPAQPSTTQDSIPTPERSPAERLASAEISLGRTQHAIAAWLETRKRIVALAQDEAIGKAPIAELTQRREILDEMLKLQQQSLFMDWRWFSDAVETITGRDPRVGDE